MKTPNRNRDGSWYTVGMVMEDVNMNRAAVMKIAMEAEALFRYGRVIRIDIGKFREYFSRKYSCSQKLKGNDAK